MSDQKRKTAKLPLVVLALLYAAILLVPAMVFGGFRLYEKKDTEALPEKKEAAGFLDGRGFPAQREHTEQFEDVFSIYDTAAKQVLQVPAEKFLPAALACEMDLSAPKEALKAQAVAIYTFYSRQRASGEKNHGADLTCDSEQWRVYVPEEVMRERWGENFEENYNILQEAAQEVKGQKLTWQGEPACTAYFAISSGNTESAGNVWDDMEEGFPYLQAAASPGDALADGYLSTQVFTEEEFRSAVSSAFTEDPPQLSGPAEDWFGSVETTPSGYIKNVVLGGKTISGPQLRAALSLRSACFTEEYQNGAFVFTVRGWGHGVGMSQAGAIFLAKRGETYRDILAHYYPGTELSGLAAAD